MHRSELNRAAAQATGETIATIQCCGVLLAGEELPAAKECLHENNEGSRFSSAWFPKRRDRVLAWF